MNKKVDIIGGGILSAFFMIIPLLGGGFLLINIADEIKGIRQGVKRDKNNILQYYNRPICKSILQAYTRPHIWLMTILFVGHAAYCWWFFKIYIVQSQLNS